MERERNLWRWGGAVFFVMSLAVSAWLLFGRRGAVPVETTQGIDFRATISPEDRRWLDEHLPRVTPDPFSDELEPVMAALNERERELLVIFTPPEDRFLKARHWALLPQHVTGDPRELEIFFAHLDRAVRVTEDGPMLPDPDTPEGQNAMTCITALGALRRAVETGRFTDMHGLIEEHAVRWSHGRTYAVSAGMILKQLEERGELSARGAAALARVCENLFTRDSIDRQLAIFRANYQSRSVPGQRDAAQ